MKIEIGKDILKIRNHHSYLNKFYDSDFQENTTTET